MANKNALNNLIHQASKATNSENKDYEDILKSPENQSSDIVDLNASIDLEELPVDPLDITDGDLHRAQALREGSVLKEDYDLEVNQESSVVLEEMQERINILEAEKEQYERQIVEMKENHNLELNTEKENHENEISRLQTEHQSEIEKYKTELDLIKLDDNSNDNQEEVKQLQNSLLQKENEFNSLNQEYAEFKEQYENDLKEKDKVIKSLEKDLKAVQEQSNEYDSLKEEYETKINDAKDSYEDKIKELTDSHKNEINSLTSSYEDKIKEITEKYENSEEIEITNLHQFVLNYVCRDLVTEIAADYESGIYTKEYAKELFDKFLSGDINSQDFFLLALIKEMKEKNKSSKFLGESSVRILDYFIEEEVTLL